MLCVMCCLGWLINLDFAGSGVEGLEGGLLSNTEIEITYPSRSSLISTNISNVNVGLSYKSRAEVEPGG